MKKGFAEMQLRKYMSTALMLSQAIAGAKSKKKRSLMWAVLPFGLIAIPAAAQRSLAEQEASAAATTVVEAFNKALHAKDATGIAFLYTDDAIRVGPDGPEIGRAEIQKVWTETFKVYEPEFAKLDRVEVIGNDVILSVLSWAGTNKSPNGPVPWKGYAVWTDTRNAGHWKIRSETFNLTPPPAQPKR